MSWSQMSAAGRRGRVAGWSTGDGNVEHLSFRGSSRTQKKTRWADHYRRRWPISSEEHVGLLRFGSDALGCCQRIQRIDDRHPALARLPVGGRWDRLELDLLICWRVLKLNAVEWPAGAPTPDPVNLTFLDDRFELV